MQPKGRLSLAGTCFVLSVATAAGSKTDLESRIRAKYIDRGAVSAHVVSVRDGAWEGQIHYLESGNATGKAVIFCHGAAFTSETWKITGVLDVLAGSGFRAIALDLPGYGRSRTSKLKDTSNFLYAFANALNLLDADAKVVVVTASMGGSYGLPMVLEHASDTVAGYVTVAGSSDIFRKYSGTMVWDIPALLIYGSQDERLRSGEPEKYRRHFPHSELVIFKDAPHPAYLRDNAAATEFSQRVLAFVSGGQQSVSARW